MELFNKRTKNKKMIMYLKGIHIVITILTIILGLLLHYNFNINFFYYLFWVISFIAILIILHYAKKSLCDYWCNRKDFLKYYEHKTSKITFKDLINEIDDYEAIIEKAVEIYKSEGDYYFSYLLGMSDINYFEDKEYEYDLLKRFKETVPSLIREIKDIEFVSFEENNYSVLEDLTLYFKFIDIKTDSFLNYSACFINKDEYLIKIVNSRIVNKILNENSKEIIIAKLMLFLFYGDF